MQIQFLGAVRTTTGSMHLITANGRRVLLECGLYQGKRKEAFERNRNIPFDPTSLDAVVLSHAHIDHSGNLPTLARRGLRCRVHATPATTDLCAIMLADSARIQVGDVEYVNELRHAQGKNPFEPLYEPKDVDKLMTCFTPIAYETPTEIVPGVRITFHDAGHILGSAVTEIHVTENGATHSLLFTGDLGRKNMPILRDPVEVAGCETLITESTYGNRLHEEKVSVSDRLRDLINETAKRRSKLIIPAFSVGRTQQILYFLDELHRAGKLSDVPVVVDSPLATRATEVYERHTECYDEETLAKLRSGDTPFSFPRLRTTRSVDESKALNHQAGPLVIISASGMCEGGRVLHHLKHGVSNPANIVLFVGFQAEHTLGRYLTDGVSPVRIFGEEQPVRARIEKIDALSGHADANELMAYFTGMEPGIQRAYVVHGELDGSEALAASLTKLGVPHVEVPTPAETVTI